MNKVRVAKLPGGELGSLGRLFCRFLRADRCVWRKDRVFGILRFKAGAGGFGQK